MTHQAERDPKATIKALQEQFRDLCVIGMRGAEAISSFRENPREKLAAVKECTAQIQAGISELRTDLEGAKVALLSGQEIYVWEYQALKDIVANAGLLIEEIEGRIGVQNGSVVRLELDYTGVSGLNPLANLSSLRELWLNDTRVSDLTPLVRLPFLQELNLYGTQVSDLTPLANLSYLQELNLYGTQASDITPLANLSSLQRLGLSGTPVSDLAVLANLSSLQELDLGCAQVTDITPLANLSSLRWLALSDTQVTDISSLANLPSLEKLWLGNTLALTASRHIIAALENRGVEVIK